MQKRVDELKQEEAILRDHIISNLPKSDAMGITGRACRVAIKQLEKPKVDDWDEVWAYINKTDSRDILQRRLSDTAVADRWDAGEEIPGISKYNLLTLSITKR